MTVSIEKGKTVRLVSCVISLATALVAGQTGWGSPLSQACYSSRLSQRIIAIGDVHGSRSGLETMLREAGLRDSAGNWTGDKSILIHTGDLIDRGSEDRFVLELLMDLEAKARKSGGKVEVLLGNHEVMNMFGDLRYVAPASFARFADDKSGKRREKAVREYEKFLKARAHFLDQPEPKFDDALRQAWIDGHPAGYLEHREAFSPSGKFGKWLRKKDAILEEGGFIFLHGGLDPALPPDVEKLNSIIRQEIKTYDQIRQFLRDRDLALDFHDYPEALSLAETYAEFLRSKPRLQADEKDLLQITEALTASPSWLSVHPNGPLWFRGFAKWSDQEAAPRAEQLADSFDVCGFVVGHSPQLSGGIGVRSDGRIFLIDTGMLTSYYRGGIPSALEISENGFVALYPNSHRVLLTADYQNTP